MDLFENIRDGMFDIKQEINSSSREEEKITIQLRARELMTNMELFKNKLEAYYNVATWNEDDRQRMFNTARKISKPLDYEDIASNYMEEVMKMKRSTISKD